MPGVMEMEAFGISWNGRNVDIGTYQKILINQI